jgi:hypothetical protein
VYVVAGAIHEGERAGSGVAIYAVVGQLSLSTRGEGPRRAVAFVRHDRSGSSRTGGTLMARLLV